MDITFDGASYVNIRLNKEVGATFANNFAEDCNALKRSVENLELLK